MKIEMNKDVLVELGKGAGKIGKSIIVEGTKAVVLKSTAAVITQAFEGGFGSVNELDLDDMLKGGKKNKTKGKLFSFKAKKDEGTVEAEVDVEVEEDEVIIPEKVEVVKEPKQKRA